MMPKLRISILIAIFTVLNSCSLFQTSSNTEGERARGSLKYSNIDIDTWIQNSKTSKIKGWNFLADKLIASGVPKTKVIEILSNPKMLPWTQIPFKVKPKESNSIYASLNTKETRKNALAFYAQNKAYFISAEKKFQIPKEYILAILQVETACGQNTGEEPIFYWLSRLVSAGFPPNLNYNYENSEENPKPTLKELEERAAWLEEEFYPHVLALIDLATELGISPLDVKGSKGGALGLPQFLPKNIAKFGADGDSNGSVNIFTPPDAIHSIANFLSMHGWKPGEKHGGKGSQLKSDVTDSILNYNRSTAYANTVFEMANLLKPSL